MKVYNKFILSFFCALVFSVPSFSSDWSQNIKVSGKAETFHTSYIEKVDGKRNANNEVALQVDIQSNKGKPIGFYSSIRLREDFLDDKRRKAYAKELYLFFKKEKYTFSLGKQIYEWGMTDKIRPTDNLCPIDYYDFLESEKLGVLSANLNFYTKIGRFQAIFMPMFSASQMPDTKNRWYLDQVDVLSPSFGNKQISIELIEGKIPAEDVSSCQYAFEYTHSFGGLDIALNFYDGYVHIPSYFLLNTKMATDTIKTLLSKNYYEQKIIGGSLAKTFGKYSARIDAAYFIHQKEDDYFRYNVGVDRTFFDSDGYNSLFVLFQWMSEINKSGVEYSNYDINHLFTRSLMAKIEWSHGMSTKIGVQGIYTFRDDNYYIQPYISYNIGDGLNALCSVDLLGGEDGGFYAYYGFQRIRVGMNYSF